MTDVSTGRSTPRRENRHDQGVLSGEVRRLVATFRAGQVEELRRTSSPRVVPVPGGPDTPGPNAASTQLAVCPFPDIPLVRQEPIK
jgi:hypothetical protein